MRRDVDCISHKNPQVIPKKVFKRTHIVSKGHHENVTNVVSMVIIIKANYKYKSNIYTMFETNYSLMQWVKMKF